MSSLQQGSLALGSSQFLSLKPFHHPSYDYGRSCRKLIPPVQASMAGNEDHRSATLTKSHQEESSSRSYSVSSLLKAVQEGGSSVVLQQVSSMRHFFIPDLPQVLLREIKKRMALPFKDQEDEENPIQDDLNGGLLKEDLAVEQGISPGPRCTWPRLKLAIAGEEGQEEAIQGPRCAWPRASVQMQSASSFVQQVKKEERVSTGVGESVSGAKCSWPRATSRNHNQNSTESLVPSGSYLEASQEEGLVPTRSSLEGNGALYEGSQEGLENLALPKGTHECSSEEVKHVNNSVIEGPRCAWPRGTPRRMLATGVGLGLVNYLLIGQGAPAFAILLDNPFLFTCEEEPSHPLVSLLP